jgi:predicted nucleotidyltransferase
MTARTVGDGGNPLKGEERRKVDHLVMAVRVILGEDLIGAYMHGSAVLGGLRPHSDIDVLIVSAHSTTRAQKQQLVDYLLATSTRGAAHNIELTIVVQSEVRPWRFPPRMDFQFGGWLRDKYESGDLEPFDNPNPDLAPLLTMVLLGDWALVGPRPAEVLDPVPTCNLLAAGVGVIGELIQGCETDTRNTILALARIWKAVATKAVDSKEGAANWALARLPRAHRPVLARARAIYRGEEENRWDDVRDQVRAYSVYVASEIHETMSPKEF